MLNRCKLIVGSALLLCACGQGSGLPGRGADQGRTVVYRDGWGVAHIYAPSAEAGAYAMGYAQAEDRPQELLKNFLRGMGESARVEGPQAVPSDLSALMWDHYAVARRKAAHNRPRTLSLLRAYVQGVNDYYIAHPADRPEWWGDRQADEFMVIAFARLFLYSWSAADSAGNICYQRTGRVPKRPSGHDWTRPVDGTTSQSEWGGWHPASELVQLLNPSQGYMQDCNVPPDAMLVGSPLRPENHPGYIFSDPGHGPLSGWSAVPALPSSTSTGGAR